MTIKAIEMIIREMNDEVESQKDLVRGIYEKEGLSEHYKAEFEALHDLRNLLQSFEFRKERGLSITAKTPYCLGS